MNSTKFIVSYSLDGQMCEETISALSKYDVAARLGSKYYKDHEMYIFSIQMLSEL